MNARTTHGQCFRGADPPEPREYVGSLEMSVQVGRRTEQAAARWGASHRRPSCLAGSRVAAKVDFPAPLR